MSYADPQTVTIDGTAIPLPRTGSGESSGSFTANDGQTALLVSHNYGRRTRRTIRLNSSKISSDPLVPSANLRSSSSVYLVVDQPVNGYTSAELKKQVDGFLALLSASSGAAITKLLGGES